MVAQTSHTCAALARGKPRVVAVMQHAVAALDVLDVTRGCDQRTLIVGCNPLTGKNATLSTATQIEVQASPCIRKWNCRESAVF